MNRHGILDLHLFEGVYLFANTERFIVFNSAEWLFWTKASEIRILGMGVPPQLRPRKYWDI